MALTTPAAIVGANVRAEMARKGTTQRNLADYLGIPQTSVSRRLSGITPFDINELTAVAELLDVHLDVLLPMNVTAGTVGTSALPECDLTYKRRWYRRTRDAGADLRPHLGDAGVAHRAGEARTGEAVTSDHPSPAGRHPTSPP
jgi:transcriptional regulator with XRE-family HTH domain